MKIISGGQTGVDRAALDLALEKGIPCGGFCPKGRLAEDGKIGEQYPLSETISESYDERTQKNIDSSDGTLVIYKDKIDKGTELTMRYCSEIGKPIIIVKSFDEETISIVLFWIKINNILTLNVAGPRESNEPGIYDFAKTILEKIIESS
jgi:hypothetical protein